MSAMPLISLQSNYARETSVMHNLDQHLGENNIRVATLQDPWVVNDCARGLPADMQVFTAKWSANELGVCV